MERRCRGRRWQYRKWLGVGHEGGEGKKKKSYINTINKGNIGGSRRAESQKLPVMTTDPFGLSTSRNSG